MDKVKEYFKGTYVQVIMYFLSLRTVIFTVYENAKFRYIYTDVKYF